MAIRYSLKCCNYVGSFIRLEYSANFISIWRSLVKCTRSLLNDCKVSLFIFIFRVDSEAYRMFSCAFGFDFRFALANLVWWLCYPNICYGLAMSVFLQRIRSWFPGASWSTVLDRYDLPPAAPWSYLFGLWYSGLYASIGYSSDKFYSISSIFCYSCLYSNLAYSI